MPDQRSHLRRLHIGTNRKRTVGGPSGLNQQPADQNPQDVTARVEEVRREVEQATAHQKEFAARWRHLAVALQDAGLTNRDVAHLLGVTEPRVTRLAPRDGRRSVPSPVPPTS